MSETKISVNPKGPIIIEGDVRITDKYGRPLDTGKKGKMCVMCGCGQSRTRPFCDGSHNQNGDDEDD